MIELLFSFLLLLLAQQNSVYSIEFFNNVDYFAEYLPIPERIVGGAPVKEFITFQVGLIDKDETLFCGGSIIGSYWIITAAHCMFEKIETHKMRNISDITVNYATMNVYKDEKEVAYVEKIITNEKFKASQDIALLQLKEPGIKLGKKDSLRIRLTPMPTEVGEEAAVSGWGAGSKNGDLYNATVVTQNFTDCFNQWNKHQYERKIAVEPGMLCAFSKSADAGSGDSGGPLNRRIGENFYLIGIVSWGYPHGNHYQSDSPPGVYCDVYYHRDWIKQNILQNSDTEEKRNDPIYKELMKEDEPTTTLSPDSVATESPDIREREEIDDSFFSKPIVEGEKKNFDIEDIIPHILLFGVTFITIVSLFFSCKIKLN